MRTCPICAEHFTPRLFHSPKAPGQIYCTPRCRQISARRKTLARRKHQIAATADVAPFSRREIYERDEWRCRICREGVDRSKRSPAPDAPTLDHIIPLSRGGTHTYANVQTTHYRCNVQKGDQLL